MSEKKKKTKRRSYDTEFKSNALKLLAYGRSISSVAIGQKRLQDVAI